jgi:hypothetical protein
MKMGKTIGGPDAAYDYILRRLSHGSLKKVANSSSIYHVVFAADPNVQQDDMFCQEELRKRKCKILSRAHGGKKTYGSFPENTLAAHM